MWFAVLVGSLLAIQVGAERSGVAELHVPADYPEIQDAIDAAAPFSTIVVGPGSYRQIRYGGKPLKIVSSAGPRFTVITPTHYGVPCVGFFDGEGAEAQLVGFRIQGGSYFYGGGIHCEGAAPFIADCVISGNRGDTFGDVGYGLGVCGGSPILYRCVIQWNIGACWGINGYAVGGGVFGSPHMIECVVRWNTAGIGGGAVLESGAVVEDCLFLENEVGPCANQYGPADAYGGAGTAAADVVLLRCRFVRNRAYGVTDIDGFCHAYEPGMWGGDPIDCVELDNKVQCFH